MQTKCANKALEFGPWFRSHPVCVAVQVEALHIINRCCGTKTLQINSIIEILFLYFYVHLMCPIFGNKLYLSLLSKLNFTFYGCFQFMYQMNGKLTVIR